MYWINVAQIMGTWWAAVKTSSCGVNSSIVLLSFKYIP
jgi:hypothetical protein